MFRIPFPIRSLVLFCFSTCLYVYYNFGKQDIASLNLPIEIRLIYISLKAWYNNLYLCLKLNLYIQMTKKTFQTIHDLMLRRCFYRTLILYSGWKIFQSNCFPIILQKMVFTHLCFQSRHHYVYCYLFFTFYVIGIFPTSPE